MNMPAERPMVPDSSPESSPHAPATPRLDGAFTAVMIPLGAFAGIILLFALWTTDQLIIPGLSTEGVNDEVLLLNVRIGSTALIHAAVWGAGFLLVFILAGGALGFAVGKGLDRLARWGT